MKAHWKKSLLLFLLMAFLCVSGNVWAAATTVYVSNLQPSWSAPGGVGVWAAYYAPDSDNYDGISPGAVAVFDGRVAGTIKAGITPEPSDTDKGAGTTGHYYDEGLLAFKVPYATPLPNVNISTFATQTLTYDVENQTGANPVWVRIRLTDAAQTEYQFWPAHYSTGWHTINAAAGQWQKMTAEGNGTGPWITLAQVAAANPGVSVDRVYLTLGQGDSYNVSPGVGTVAWVDNVTIGDVTYVFVLKHTYAAKTGSDSNDCLTANTACLTVQAAVNAADDGDTVTVEPGTYVESVMVTKSIKLIAPHGATIQCPVSPSYVYVAESAAQFLYTVGLFGGTYDGVTHTVSGTGTITVEMSGFTIDANHYPVAHPAEYASILSRNVNKAHADGVASIHNNNLINFSFINGQTIGIQGYGTMDITVDSNTVTKFNRCGIDINTGAAVITNNTVRGASDEPTQSWASNGIETGANGTVQGNDISYCGWPGASNWAGTGLIVFDPATSVLVTKNNIHDCTDGQGHGTAVYILGDPGSLSGVSFKNNTIKNCDWGVNVYGDVNGVLLAYNTFSGMAGDSIDVWWNTTQPRAISINFNSITGTGSGYDGLWVQNGLTGTINATNNWWGRDNGPSHDGPGSGDTVNAGTSTVFFNPWLVKPSEGYHYLTADYGSAGLWKFDGVSAWAQATTQNIDVMAYYFDGVKEKIYTGNSTGVWSYEMPSLTATHLGAAVPENLMAFKSLLLIDYGAKYGLYKYNGASATQLSTMNPGIMCNAGSYALIDFPGYGVYKYDGNTSNLLGTAHPNNMIKFGSGVLLDYGAKYGLYIYNGTSAIQIDASAPGIMCSVGSYALIDVPGKGLYKYDGTSYTLAGTAHPENIVALSGAVALLDYGVKYGVWKYDGTTATQLGTADPAKMVQVNSQVFLDYAVYGLYSYDGTTTTHISKPSGVTNVAEQMLDVGMH